eukprot:SAG31_NODE_255_length_19039_cov_83.461774_9_plen_110_part_00
MCHAYGSGAPAAVPGTAVYTREPGTAVPAGRRYMYRRGVYTRAIMRAMAVPRARDDAWRDRDPYSVPLPHSVMASPTGQLSRHLRLSLVVCSLPHAGGAPRREQLLVRG